MRKYLPIAAFIFILVISLLNVRAFNSDSPYAETSDSSKEELDSLDSIISDTDEWTSLPDDSVPSDTVPSDIEPSDTVPELPTPDECCLRGDILGSDAEKALAAFDGDPMTWFAGEPYASNPGGLIYGRNWVGLDLGEKHVITGFTVIPVEGYEQKSRFALAEGANDPGFIDALPLGIIKMVPLAGEAVENEVNVSRGFRYVRLTACDGEGYFAEVKFYGEPGEGDDSRFYQVTNLPTVVVNTPGMVQIKEKEEKVEGSYVALISEDGSRILENEEVRVKGRGNSTWTYFPKKPYQIKFKKKQRPLNAPAKAKKWTLLANYVDRSLMRNKLAFDISQAAGMKYTPYCEFVDLIFNGEYQGSYNLCDQVEVAEGRVEVSDITPADTVGEELTGGYFLEIDARANQEKSWFKSVSGVPVTIKYPDEDDIVAAQSKYIKNHFDQFTYAIYRSNFRNPDLGYRRYLDLDSFLRLMLVKEAAGDIDSLWSLFLWKERNDSRFYFGPAWDYDLAFGNYGGSSGPAIEEMTDFIHMHPACACAPGVRSLVSRIIQDDEEAFAEMRNIWTELRTNHEITPQYFISKVDEYEELLAESQELNFQRWPILRSVLMKEQPVLGSHEEEVNRLRQYFLMRLPMLDERFGIKSVGVDKPSAPRDIVDGWPAEILYDLQGRRVRNENGPLKGIYISRSETGEIRKIVIP